MYFAKFFRFSLACWGMFLLSGCVTSSPSIDMERHNAMKARANLALAYLAQHDFAKAKENIDKALAHDSQDYLPYAIAAYYYQQLNDAENAEKNYRIAIQQSQRQPHTQQALPEVLNNYGTFLCQQQKFDEAYQQFEQALATEQRYTHQADTLENIITCSPQENARERREKALTQLKQLAPERAITYR